MSKEEEILELVRRYEQAIAEDKSIYFDADQFGDIASYYDSIDDIDAIKDLLEIALKIHPESEQILIKKAKVLVYENEYKQALQILNSISSGYELDFYMLKIECLLQLNKIEDANNLAGKTLESEDELDQYILLAELGFLFVEADRFKEANDYFERSLEIDPENIDVLSDLSYCYEMMGNYDEAIKACNKILDIDPYHYEAWIGIGKLYSLKDDFEKAVDAFDFALTINDSDNVILKLKAHCLSLIGRQAEAIAIFKELLETEEEDTTLYLLLAESYTSLGLYNEALTYLEGYKEIEGETADYFMKQIHILFHLEKYEQALRVLDLALAKYNDRIELLILAGDIKFDLLNFEGAEQNFLQAYALEENNADVLNKLSITYIRKEDYEQAIKFAEKLLHITPEDLDLKQRLALLYFEIDDKQQFNHLLNDFDDEELMNLFRLFYNPKNPESFDRESLIASLNEAREYRTLFKNIQH